MPRPQSADESSLVLIHGYAVDTPDWEPVVWGDPFAGELGRVPAGLFEALRRPRSRVLFGSAQGAPGGVSEAEYTLSVARERAVELVFVFAPLLNASPADVRAYLDKILGEGALTTQTALNTKEEVSEAAAICSRDAYDELVLVSSPNHLPRCLAEALAVADAKGDNALRKSLRVRASDTDYGGGAASSTRVLDGVPGNSQPAGPRS